MTSTMSPPLLPTTLLLGLLLPLSTLAEYDSYEKDPNTYPWGDNPNNGYKMYWKDSANVLTSLKQFSSLYIKVHGCIWSEYGMGDTFDDDGENHDGDEQWYLTRVQTFRANTAFSLYGELKGTFNLGMNCRKGTYINTFFTALGADTVLQAFENSVQTAFPDELYGSAYCYEYETYDDDDGGYEDGDDGSGDRKLDSNSGDNDDAVSYNSMTMGCSPESRFEVAHFEGSGCDGNYYLNSTDRLRTYNRAMNGLSCAKVWDYGQAMKMVDDDGADDENADDYHSSSNPIYGSIAETLLASSFSCDITLYPNGLCPDPHGLKAKYNRNIVASARSGESVMLLDWQSPMRTFSWLFLTLGLITGCLSYFALKRANVTAKGGGLKGWVKQIWADIHVLLCGTKNRSKGNGSGGGGSKPKRKIKRQRSGAISPEQLRRKTSSPGRQVRKNRSGAASPEQLRRKMNGPNSVRRNRSGANTHERQRKKNSSPRRVRRTKSGRDLMDASSDEMEQTEDPCPVSPASSTLYVLEEERPSIEDGRVSSRSIEDRRATSPSIEEKREFV